MADGNRPDSAADSVPGWVHRIGRHVARHPAFWRRLANFETRILSDELQAIPIDRPIYVCGLARSGTTIILETLSRHSATISHRYSDYPFVFTPFWWNWLLARMPQAKTVPQERTHKDGILVTPDSPEALEEVLWMSFFDNLHDPHQDNRLTEGNGNREFERFYKAHLRKLLKVSGRVRYLAKGNYNLTRIPYLLNMFPDARFIVPLRDPVWHIASLRKQHRLFCTAERKSSSLLDHMRRVGHFEFGLDWRPVNPGRDDATRRVLEYWEHGEEIRAWAAYWALIHDYILDLAPRTGAIRLVNYEELCARPHETVHGILEHSGLEPEPAVSQFAETLHAPRYYRPDFSAAEMAIITGETAETAAALGLA